jgi:ADP-heptose:LPS heptosyltransferase
LRWWEERHQVEEVAHSVGVPGPIDLQTEIAIPAATAVPAEAAGKIVLHNDPAIDGAKAWPWERVRELAQALGPHEIVLLGSPGPPLPGALDLRGKTSLAEAAATIAASSCYVGIDSGLMWIAGSLQVPAVGLYGTSSIPALDKIHPRNPRALYLQAQGPLSEIPVANVVAAIGQVKERGAPATPPRPPAGS